MALTNRLIYESSPYLLQHAHNPVDWYAWGEDAFQKAVKEDKPVMVSIGYAACHWCHVMERESFEDEGTARLMNENFINIKVDREERPDIDHIYMDAVQAMTGSGGWPLNVFLTPDKQPFFGGTYFPPKPVYQRSSWKDVLLSVAKTYKEKKQEVEGQAEQLRQYILQSNQFGQQKSDLAIEPELPLNILKNILQQADKKNGGFGGAPKFPSTFILQYLLCMYDSTQNEEALQQLRLSLDKMSGGGIYDHIGGGFARYSTDTQWLVPHFEKMLYDNALLVSVLSEAYKITHSSLYEKAIRHTLDYIAREMTDEAGAFFASQDADSEGLEGKYYIWQKKEVTAILGEDAALFCEFYDITEEGNWEGANIPHTEKALMDFARVKDIDAQQIQTQFEKNIAQLLAVREQRVPPAKDTKVILSWNALMIIAFCDAYAALGMEDYKEAAEKNAAFIWEKMRDEKEENLYHVYKDGQSKHPAFLEDYALYIKALIRLQEITGDKQYLSHARALTNYTILNFSDEDNIYFYFTPAYQQDVIVRKKEIFDSALPSGNSIMAENLLYLSVILDEPEYKERSEKMAAGLAKTVEKYPLSFGVWAAVTWKITTGLKEVAIVGAAYREKLKELLIHYIPGSVIMASADEDDRFPLLRNRQEAGKTYFYLCRDYHCEAPVKDISALLSLIKNN